VLNPPIAPEPPVGSVVLDKDGHAWQRVETYENGEWWCTHEVPDLNWGDLNNELGPLMVLDLTPAAELTKQKSPEGSDGCAR
jgi:hypothetical protein